MKASIKFRDQKTPLFRAKVPLNILGFPFQSGVVAGEHKELSLNLNTFFESGPALKLAYRPNDSSNPFSIVFKTGIGHFGSPVSSSLNMSAEFSLIPNFQNPNPSFYVHFKPQFGDFTIKKTHSSAFNKHSSGCNNVNEPEIVDFIETGMEFTSFKYPVSGALKGVLTDVEVAATTAVPLRKNAKLNFRWGVRVPASEETAMVLMKKSNNVSTAGISFQKLPVLLINKIGIEHVASGDSKVLSKVGVGAVGGDVAEVFKWGKKQLDVVQGENVVLRKAMDDLKCEFSAVKSRSNKGGNNSHFGANGIEVELVNDDMKKNGMKGSSDV